MRACTVYLFWLIFVYLFDSVIVQLLRVVLCIHSMFCAAVQDANFATQLELAVRFGKTLIIQEVDGVEPMLYPLLRGDLIAQGKLP